MKKGYMFGPKKPISPEDPDYNTNPDLFDEAYCMVYVLAAERINLTEDKMLNKLRYIREKASTKWGLPQVIVMTNVDQACPLVHKQLQKIYLSKKIRSKMEWCSGSLGVPMSYIFPVKNYHEEIETNDDMDVLILQAFKQIMELANDHLEICLKNRANQNVREKQPKSVK
nr:interferon-induced protein 44-like [Misgurnus anguillicaudatus]